MNRINRKIEYALMALKYMSQKIPGELSTAKEVSDTFRTPFDATARVMQIMASRGLLRSEQGATGGYQILRDISKVNVLDLIEMIEGPVALVKCGHREEGENCEIQSTCNIISPLTHLSQKVNEFYRGITLKELLVDSVPSRSIRRRGEEMETPHV